MYLVVDRSTVGVDYRLVQVESHKKSSEEKVHAAFVR